MSSLQKFHRRTMSFGPPPTWPPSVIGGGDVAHGFWLGTAGDGTSKLIYAPKSTETFQYWGSMGTYRGVISTTNGIANTNTLYALGSTAHPAAYAAKSVTTGGYNTWYLPAVDELLALYSCQSVAPFSTTNGISTSTTVYASSTELNGSYAYNMRMTNWTRDTNNRKNDLQFGVRACRRTTF